MNNYKETTVTGQSWQRCSQLVIDNNLNKTPVIRFEEQRVVSLDNSKIVTQLGNFSTDYDPQKIITIFDPETNELTGETITYAQVYKLLYSAYITEALARDTLNSGEAQHGSDN
jgi:Cu2+-containing amine oxidase